MPTAPRNGKYSPAPALESMAHGLRLQSGLRIALLSIGRSGLLLLPLLVPAAVLTTLRVWPVRPELALLTYLALVTIASVLSYRRNRPTLARVLLDADQYYHTGELLSTAYAYLHREEPGRFGRALLHAADRQAQSVRPAEVYPAGGAWRAAVPAGLGLALVMLILFGGADPAGEDDVERGRRLQELGSRLAARAPDERDTESSQIARELQRLGKDIEQASDRGESRERARDILERVEEQIDTLRRGTTPEPTQESEALTQAETELRAYLSNTETARSATRRMPVPSGSGSSSDGSQRSDGAGDGSRGGPDSERSDPDGGQTGDQAPRDPQDPQSGPQPDQQPKGDPPQRDELQQGEPGESGPPPGSSEDGAGGDRSSRSGEPSRRPREGGGNAPPQQRQGVDPPEGSRGERPGSGSESGTAEGRITGRDEGRRGSGGASGGSTHRLESQVGKGPVIQLFMRRLAEQAKAGTPPAELEESYTRAVEEAMSRQAVPSEYAALVRNYFIVIGRAAGNAQTERETQGAKGAENGTNR